MEVGVWGNFCERRNSAQGAGADKTTFKNVILMEYVHPGMLYISVYPVFGLVL